MRRAGDFGVRKKRWWGSRSDMEKMFVFFKFFDIFFFERFVLEQKKRKNIEKIGYSCCHSEGRIQLVRGAVFHQTG